MAAGRDAFFADNDEDWPRKVSSDEVSESAFRELFETVARWGASKPAHKAGSGRNGDAPH